MDHLGDDRTLCALPGGLVETDRHTAAAIRRIEWMVTRYLNPTPERETPPPTSRSPYVDHPDQLVTRNPYLT